MVLYAADLDDILPTKKISRKRKVSQELDETTAETVTKEEKPKRVLTEKQKEALKKGQETRRLKKEQAAKEKAEQEALQQKLLAAAPKKRTKKSEPKPEPKSEVKPEVKPEPEPVVESEPVSEPVEKPKKKRAQKKKENEAPIENIPVAKKRKRVQDPPEWFTKYVEGVQKEKAQGEGQVSKKQEKIIKDEALKVAKKSWESGFTRDRVENEVDNHSNYY